MPDKYFENFPKIVYDDAEIVDITKRTALLERVSRNPYVFYPYDLETYERPDQFSYRYYNDEYASWLLYFTNKVLDPYYDWYLQQDEFLALIELKYGSIPEAQRKIKHYRNNWVSEYGTFLNASGFAALTEEQKTYYDAVIDSEGYSKTYKRKEVDWILDTNKIYCYGVNATENFLKVFKQDEIVNIYLDDNNKGLGQFVSYKLDNPYEYPFVNQDKILETKTLLANTVTLKHMSGKFDTNIEQKVYVTPQSYLQSTETGIKVKMLQVDPSISGDYGIVIELAENISESVARFWSPVTYYEYENELNEYNKSVRVMDSRYKAQAAKDLKTLMKE